MCSQFTKVSLKSILSSTVITIIIIIIIIITTTTISSLLYGVLFNYFSALFSVCVLFGLFVLSSLLVVPFS